MVHQSSLKVLLSWLLRALRVVGPPGFHRSLKTLYIIHSLFGQLPSCWRYKGDFGGRAKLSRRRWRLRHDGLRAAVGRQCGKARGTNELVGEILNLDAFVLSIAVVVPACTRNRSLSLVWISAMMAVHRHGL